MWARPASRWRWRPRWRAEHPDGVWLIELASLRDPRDVAAAVATALGLDDAARLEPFLADKDVLLVVDNCEHVIDEAASVVERLLRAGAGVRVLATSREGLGVGGEVRWTVPPLAAGRGVGPVPASGPRQAAAPTRRDDAALVERICDRLDGLPLAVELAAARTRSLSLADIVDRLDDRFRLLTTGGRTAEPRQQTLRRVVDWSYDLLFADEQRVFRRLSVFAGGFDLAAAEAVCAGDDVAVGDVVDILGHLVDKSLVSVIDRDDGTRYRLLQTLVDYGRERLDRGRRGRGDPGPSSAVDGRVRGGGRARPARGRPAAVDPPAGLGAGQRPCRAGLGGAAGTGRRRGGDGRRAGVRLVHHRRGCRRAGLHRPSPRDGG